MINWQVGPKSWCAETINFSVTTRLHSLHFPPPTRLSSPTCIYPFKMAIILILVLFFPLLSLNAIHWETVTKKNAVVTLNLHAHPWSLTHDAL